MCGYINIQTSQQKKLQETLCNDKRLIHQEDKAILNVYAPNNRAAKYVKQTNKLKVEIDKSTILVTGFNTSLSTIDRIAKQKISMDIEELNNIVSQEDAIDIC